MHSRQLDDQSERLIERPTAFPRASLRRTVAMPLANGAAPAMCTFNSLADRRDGHFALRFAAQDSAQAPLMRIHSSCVTGDILGSERCDCGPQLRESIELFTRRGGVLIYLNQEGRGIGLTRKIDAYAMQEGGLDTFAANRALGFRDDERDYLMAAQILDVLLPGLEIRLLTNSPEKAVALERYGIQVKACIQTGVFATAANRRYLQVLISTQK
jgi:GTP cyclohydrolase II